MVYSNLAVAKRLCEATIDSLETGDREQIRLKLEYIRAILESPHETNADFPWDDLG